MPHYFYLLANFRCPLSLTSLQPPASTPLALLGHIPSHFIYPPLQLFNHLRSALNPSALQYATPATLARTLWACAVTRYYDQGLALGLLELLGEHVKSSDDVDTTVLVHVLPFGARFGVQHPVLEAAKKAFVRLMPRLEAEGLATCLWSLAVADAMVLADV